MLPTYKAILRGNSLEWDDATPESVSSDRPVAVYVTILDTIQAPPPSLASGQQMAAILEQLAQQPTLMSIADPIAWEREQRGERLLPGRDE